MLDSAGPGAGRHSAAALDAPRHRAVVGVHTTRPVSHNGRGRFLAAMAVALAAVGGVAAIASSSAVALPSVPAGAVIVQDGFERTVEGGLGSAPVGGKYAVTGQSSQFSVAPGVATVASIGAATPVTANLASVDATDVDAAVDFSLPERAQVGGGLYVNLELRRQLNGDVYRARVRVYPDGQLVLGFSQVRAGVEYRLGAVKLAPQTASPDQVVRLEASVDGVGPAELRARTYVVGTPVPAWQISYTDASSTGLDADGSVGLWVYPSSTAPPTTILFHGLLARTLSPIGPGAPGSSSAPPSSSAPVPPPSSSSGAPVTTTAAPPSSSASTTTSPPSSSPVGTTSPPSTTSSAPSSTPPSSATSTPVTPPSPPAPPTTGTAPGSLPVGSAKYPVPLGALFVSPSGNDAAGGTVSAPLRTVREAVARATNGQTIVLRGGTYNESVFIPANKDIVIQSYPGEAVWFDGSVPVTNWTPRGSTWVSTGWNAQFDHSASFTRGSDAGGFVSSAYPMAAWPDQVFVDGVQLDQVAGAPGPGQFSVDYSARTLTIGSDPAGHEVRASNLAQAFVVAGRATLRGFGVQRYATALPQIATIYLGGSVGGDTVENVVVSDNATQGLSIATPNTVVNHVTSSANGMTGLHSNNGSGSMIENSLVQGNDTQHFNGAPASAGIKITRANGFVIRDNRVINNLGINGIWTDVTVSNFQIIGNTVAGNNGAYGVITELSDTGVVADNTISDNSYGYTAYDTGNVRVYNNSFSNDRVWDVGVSQDSRRNTGANADTVPWLARNITVSDNAIGTPDANFGFYALDKATNIPASRMNLVVDGNVFTVASSGKQSIMVGWGGSNNRSVTYYRSSAALDQGLDESWSNAQITVGGVTANADSAAGVALGLPADIAEMIGVAPGTRHIGAF